MKAAKTDSRLAGSTRALSIGIFFLALFILAFSSALPVSAAGTANVTEVHDYPGAVDTRAPRSVPIGETNLLDWQQTAYDGVEYELESITVEKTALTYTVAFDANAGAPTPPAQTVEHGGKVSEPADPARNGYAFAGWYTAVDFSGSAWDFANDTITGDMGLYAKWVQQTYYVVVFVANGGTPVPAFQTVASGQKVTRPADPARGGYVFGGWYLQWDFSGSAWDFDNDVVTGNTILYGCWILYTESSLETDTGLDRAEETNEESKWIALDSEPEPDAFPVLIYQAPSLLDAETVWTIGQPDNSANFTFEQGSEYRITFDYKVIALTEPPTVTGGVSRPDSGYAPNGGQSAPPDQLPELDTIFYGGVSITASPQTGAHRIETGIASAILLLLCGLATGWSARKNGK